MIRLIEARNYRCLQYVRQPLGNFHVLVGPNASGKTTFLDVVAFLGRLVSDGLDAAIEERSSNFSDLLWKKEGRDFELAIEAAIPDAKRALLPKKYNTIRYELRIGVQDDSLRPGIIEEHVILKNWKGMPPAHRDIFPALLEPPETIGERDRKSVV